MARTRRRLVILVLGALLLVVLLGLLVRLLAPPSGPGSTLTRSETLPTLSDRVEFLQRYVRFRRTYETLDFNIEFHDNSGMLPGPSEWDIRLVATVPAGEIAAWIPPVPAMSTPPDVSWLAHVWTDLDLKGVNEWYEEGRKVVGIDRAKRIVVYRVYSY